MCPWAPLMKSLERSVADTWWDKYLWEGLLDGLKVQNLSSCYRKYNQLHSPDGLLTWLASIVQWAEIHHAKEQNMRKESNLSRVADREDSSVLIQKSNFSAIFTTCQNMKLTQWMPAWQTLSRREWGQTNYLPAIDLSTTTPSGLCSCRWGESSSYIC